MMERRHRRVWKRMLSKFKTCNSIEYQTVENDGSFAVHKQDGILTLYFQPSRGKTDWKNNFDFPAKPYRDMKNLWFCHRGFLKVWKSIEPYITNEINDPNVHTIEIVGYSHGGAIAALCYEYVKFNRPNVNVHGIGFGAPRVVWGFASKTVKERFDGFCIVRNCHDIVTHVPPVLFGFRHLGTVLKIKAKSKGLIDDHRPENYIENLENIV